MLKAFRSLEIGKPIISPDFTAGTRRLSRLAAPGLASRWRVCYPKSVKKHLNEHLVLEEGDNCPDRKVRLVLTVL